MSQCAPHYDGSYHVNDDRTDLMSDAGDPQVVDTGHDDYFDLPPSSPCVDVADSQLLLPEALTPSDVTPGVPSTFVPVTPTRLLDTRTGLGAPAGRLAAGGSLRLAVAGRQAPGGAVPATATAVVLNVTALAAGSTDIRAYPAGSPVPNASNVNASSGQTVPNQVSVPLGQNGQVSLRSSGGPVHLLADIAGYYLPGTGADGYAPLAPARVLDTRTGLGAPAGKLDAGGVRDLQATGALPTADGGTVTVPADASAVVLNVTGTVVTASTDVRVDPTPTGGDTSTATAPTVSNLNLTRGQTAANLVTIKVGAGGAVRLRNKAGSLHLIADIAGYYAPGAPGRFLPVTPLRLLDTRNGTGAAPQPVAAGAPLLLAVAGDRGIPADASAAALNLTATGVRANTYITAYPAGGTQVPTVSNLNLPRGSTRADAAIVRLGTGGKIVLRNDNGQTQLITDIAGYFLP